MPSPKAAPRADCGPYLDFDMGHTALLASEKPPASIWPMRCHPVRPAALASLCNRPVRQMLHVRLQPAQEPRLDSEIKLAVGIPGLPQNSNHGTTPEIAGKLAWSHSAGQGGLFPTPALLQAPFTGPLSSSNNSHGNIFPSQRRPAEPNSGSAPEQTRTHVGVFGHVKTPRERACPGPRPQDGLAMQPHSPTLQPSPRPSPRLLHTYQVLLEESRAATPWKRAESTP
ncbi:hypothetical protein BD289DRAFT_175458 [Coniella lustricola]|uniref:Uncharacterized protein n=1 Tax=Coniella lustricola TaxID=2025994 RepID=A0A2T3ADU8_9PEZI|nr:hypothetical protein BD289DRAFT_175458 [Coniella lustricola]